MSVSYIPFRSVGLAEMWASPIRNLGMVLSPRAGEVNFVDTG